MIKIFKIWKVTSAEGDVQKLDPSHSADWKVKWCSHCSTVWEFLKILN
jgi:hypothetical protein